MLFNRYFTWGIFLWELFVLITRSYIIYMLWLSHQVFSLKMGFLVIEITNVFITVFRMVPLYSICVQQISNKQWSPKLYRKKTDCTIQCPDSGEFFEHILLIMFIVLVVGFGQPFKIDDDFLCIPFFQAYGKIFFGSTCKIS